MLLSRRAANSFAASAGVANLPEGTIGSGAVAFLLRSCIPSTNLWSTSAFELAGRSTAGVFRTFLAVDMRKCSARIKFSAHSSTDQTLGAGLKVHCDCETPPIVDSIAFLDCSSCSSRYALSEEDIAPLSAAASGSMAISPASNDFVMEVFPLRAVDAQGCWEDSADFGLQFRQAQAPRVNSHS